MNSRVVNSFSDVWSRMEFVVLPSIAEECSSLARDWHGHVLQTLRIFLSVVSETSHGSIQQFVKFSKLRNRIVIENSRSFEFSSAQVVTPAAI